MSQTPLTYTAEEMSHIVSNKLSEHSSGDINAFQKRILVLAETFGKSYPPEVKGTFSMAQLTYFETAVLATLTQQYSGFPEALKALADKISREVPEIVIDTTALPRDPKGTSPKGPRVENTTAQEVQPPQQPQPAKPKQPAQQPAQQPKQPQEPKPAQTGQEVKPAPQPESTKPAPQPASTKPAPQPESTKPSQPAEDGKDKGQANLSSSLKELEKLVQSHKQELADQKQQLKALRKDLGELRGDLNNLKQEIQRLRSGAKEAEGSEGDSEDRATLSQIERRFSELSKRLSKLEAKGGQGGGSATDTVAHLEAIQTLLTEITPETVVQIRNGIKLLMILDGKLTGEWRKFRSQLATEVGAMVVECNEFRDRAEETISEIHKYVKAVFPLYR